MIVFQFNECEKEVCAVYKCGRENGLIDVVGPGVPCDQKNDSYDTVRSAKMFAISKLRQRLEETHWSLYQQSQEQMQKSNDAFVGIADCALTMVDVSHKG